MVTMAAVVVFTAAVDPTSTFSDGTDADSPGLGELSRVEMGGLGSLAISVTRAYRAA